VPEVSEYISEDEDSSDASKSGIWGVDSVSLGPRAEDIGVSNQYVIGTFLKRFYPGTFGLAVGSLGPPGADKKTILDNLYASKVIPSRSFSYTAGSAKSKSLSCQYNPWLTFGYRKHIGQPGLGRIRCIAIRPFNNLVLALAECAEYHSHCPTDCY
jgi:hypothetical protein